MTIASAHPGEHPITRLEQPAIATTAEVSVLRLYVLRAGYLLLVLGLGSVVWPGIIHHDKPWALMPGVVHCMLAAMSALAILGLRYPLKMLPLLFFELAWKSIWLIVVALPLWSAHQMDADTSETAVECLMAVVFLIVMPWRYVFSNYLTARGDRWR
jgi:hypothetical protein